MRSIRRIAVIGAGVVALAVGLAPMAHAGPPARPAPVARPTITIVTPDLLRLDKQDETTNAVSFGGIDAKSRGRVSWGDGTPTEPVTGRCATRTALAHPDWCTVRVDHYYDEPGAYTITAVVNGQRTARLVTISPAPVRWSRPAGWVQPTGWSLLTGSATYFPCQSVNWYLDRTGQPADGGQIEADVRTGLAMLSAETGLTFTETTDAALADLGFEWGDTGGYSGRGGGWGGHGEVTFDVSDDWPRDRWPGFGVVTQPDGWYGLGHGWLVVHEVMHALGMGHVNDPTAVMNPIAGAGSFNAADLAGLHTLYRDNPCPVG